MQKLFRQVIISFSSAGQCAAGVPLGHEVCGKLKSPPIMTSGVVPNAVRVLDSSDIAFLNCVFEDDLPWAESSGWRYSVTSSRFSFLE